MSCSVSVPHLLRLQYAILSALYTY